MCAIYARSEGALFIYYVCEQDFVPFATWVSLAYAVSSDGSVEILLGT